MYFNDRLWLFETQQSKLMTYDGRHCLGYEGILCLLIELFDPEASFYLDFERQCVSRKSFKIDSYYSKKEGNNF